MEGVNWEKEDYINATLNLTRMIRRILELKNKIDTTNICYIIRSETNYIFSLEFIEKLVTEYSSNQDLLNRLNIDISEMKL